MLKHALHLRCKGPLEPGRVAMPLDPAEPGFAVQQQRGHAALLLVAGPPVIDLTPGSRFAHLQLSMGHSRRRVL